MELSRVFGPVRRWAGHTRLLMTGMVPACIAIASPVAAQTETSTGPAAAMAIPNPLTLEAALEFARQHHPDVRVARSAVEVAAADSLAASVRPFNPELELGVRRGGESFASGDEGTWEVGVSQELELWGKRRQRRALATARLHTARAGFEARRQQIELQVRAGFQRALSLQRRLALLGELADQERRVVTSSASRVREGSLTPFTGRVTELDWLRLERQLLREQAAHRASVMGLALAMGARLDEAVQLAGEFSPDTLTVREDALVGAALARRRETEALQLRMVDRRAELRLTRLEGRPNLTLGAGLSRERQSFGSSDFIGNAAGIAGLTAVDYLWQARVSLPLPLFQRNQGAQARAAAEVVQAQLELERFALLTDLEARAAVRAFTDAARLYRMYLERSPRVREDLALVRAAYMDGRISFESYLTQKDRLVDTLLDQLEAEDRYWEARGVLEAAAAADLTTLGLGGSR